MSPKYRPLAKRLKPNVITVKQWTEDALGELQASLECTDWSAFTDNNTDLNNLVDVVTCYVQFCVNNAIPTKKVKVFPNNKPWITKEVKSVINKKKQIFGQRDKCKLKEVQKELKRVIRLERTKYKERIEQNFTENNIKRVWEGMRLMSGYSNGSKRFSQLPQTSSDYANELNQFYNRFDQNDFSEEVSSLRDRFYHTDSSEAILIVTESDVMTELKKLKSTKAAGPDGIPARVLKACCEELAEIYAFIFNKSFSTQTVPDLWKCSCIIPVPKRPVVSCMNDLRPVALTSIPMKVCERLFKKSLSQYVTGMLDPLQFAYQSQRSCSDAILVVLESLYSHLERTSSGNSARVMFFDFSSAFNTIQPHLLVNKLCDLSPVPNSLSAWILDYLTNRTQFVKISGSGNRSAMITSNTGAPQGTVLAPFLFTLYTSDCRSTEASCPLIKFADDTAMVGLIHKDNCAAYESELNAFVDYCDSNFLELNVTKTKEMVIDFRSGSHEPCPIYIKGSEVARVETYKYLGVTMDHKLNWHDHIDTVIKKLNTRMYCLRKLNHFDVNSKILVIFYESVIASVWRNCLICWGGNLKNCDKSRIDKLIREAGRIVGGLLHSVDAVYDKEVSTKLKKIMEDPGHPLHSILADQVIPRSGRMRLPYAATNRHPSSFIPRAIKKHNCDFNR
jgi:hypothetical protein